MGKVLLLSATLLVSLSGCSSSNIQDGPPNFYVDVSKIPNAKPRPLLHSKYGNPTFYTIHGKRYYVLKTARGYHQRGIASWYGTKFHGQLTSSHEPYNMLAMTGASPILPIPCFVRVTNLSNGRWVIVKINDRGPFATNRILDLSYAAAKKLGYAKLGIAFTEVKTVNFTHPYSSTKNVVLAKVSSSRLFIQLGAFRKRTHAENLKGELNVYLNKPIYILRSIYNQLPLYRVQIGPLVNVNELYYLHDELKKLGFEKVITMKG